MKMKLWLFLIVCYCSGSFSSVVPCGYTNWSCWSDCDASCGDKIQSRERSCSNPPPSLPGFDCSELGPAIAVRQCYGPANQIDVHGGYNHWGLWSECSKDCGGGEQYRKRWCVNPHPQGKGKECSEQKELGAPVESRSCNENDCNGEATEPPTETATKPPTTVKEPTEAPTETEPEAPTETATEPPTETEPEAPTETATEAPTETEPEAPTETVTEAPTETEPEAPTTEIGTEPPPPQPPTGTPCKISLDLGIIIDESKSISTNNLKKLIKSLAEFSGKFEISAEGTHVGMITFNSDADLLFNFKDDRYHTNDQLKQRIQNIPPIRKLETRTDLALSMANQKLFSEEGGDRSDASNVLMIFTDGKSTAKRGQKGFVPIPKAVENLEKKGVYIYAVGIGGRIKVNELQKLAGTNGGYSKVANFDKLPDILESLKEAACANAGASSDEQGQYVNGVLVDREYYNRYRSPMETFFDRFESRA